MLMNNSKKYNWILFAVGISTLLFGLILLWLTPDDAYDTNMLSGMLMGFGASVSIVGIVKHIRIKTISKETLKRLQVEQNDERNVAIMRAAYTVGLITAMALFALLSFFFVGLGYRIPAFFCIGSLYVVAIVVLITKRIYKKKM